ncbi:hypothetical protein [Romboutsia ilealis]|uniref:hypothetical protein n=1 Tax=Romboutsia ilealis TaxID=1115758 RepID=UPI0025747F78|nr:hypothetical protein [Romboutsia ilealis]
MKKIDNNFDEKLKKYSDEIKSMEIIYHNGRVKCINKESMRNLNDSNIQDEPIDIKRENQKKDFDTNEKGHSILKNVYSLILKLILTCIVFISMPVLAKKIANIGVNAFISGIGTIFISYFIINIIWVFLE